jgi:ABC-type transport system involved in multi-copper enzyme maturation permease subunit
MNAIEFSHVSKYFNQIHALEDVSLTLHLTWLFGYTVLFLALAVWAFKRDEGRTFG